MRFPLSDQGDARSVPDRPMRVGHMTGNLADSHSNSAIWQTRVQIPGTVWGPEGRRAGFFQGIQVTVHHVSKAYKRQYNIFSKHISNCTTCFQNIHVTVQHVVLKEMPFSPPRPPSDS